MNYEPNTVDWADGSIVIHDADAKEACMLMRVVGRTKDGLIKTRYATPVIRRHRGWSAKTWKNPKEVLHDPARFGIEIPEEVRRG